MGGCQTNISKSSERGVKLNFLTFFQVCKVKNFQVWVPQDNFVKGIEQGMEGRTAPPPTV